MGIFLFPFQIKHFSVLPPTRRLGCEVRFQRAIPFAANELLVDAHAKGKLESQQRLIEKSSGGKKEEQEAVRVRTRQTAIVL